MFFNPGISAGGTNYQPQINALKNRMDAAEASQEQTNTLATQNSVKIGQNTSGLSSLNSTVEGLEVSLDQTSQTLENSISQNSNRINTNSSDLRQLEDRTDDLETGLNRNTEQLDDAVFIEEG